MIQNYGEDSYRGVEVGAENISFSFWVRVF